MDAQRFDALTRALLTAGSRRGLLGVLLMLPGLGSLLAFLAPDDVAAKGRRKRRRKKKRKKRCKRKTRGKARAKLCAGTCGIVKIRKCKKKIDCGVCCSDLLPTDDLQAAIDATPAGETLRLCPGTWDLTTTVSITQDLTLIGAGAEQTSLDGGDAVQVLFIDDGIEVTLRDLTITRGSATLGGGILNNGTLTLRAMAVTGNTASFGGGILNDDGGTLTLEDGSQVSGNTATNQGGGIANDGLGTVILAAGSLVGGDSQADANTAEDGGGILIREGGTLTLQDGSRVSGNVASDFGGGIVLSGTATLQNGSRVSGNTAAFRGGIVYGDFATLTVQANAFVCDNDPPDDQCAGDGTLNGVCPNPMGGVCPSEN